MRAEATHRAYGCVAHMRSYVSGSEQGRWKEVLIPAPQHAEILASGWMRHRWQEADVTRTSFMRNTTVCSGHLQGHQHPTFQIFLNAQKQKKKISNLA